MTPYLGSGRSTELCQGTLFEVTHFLRNPTESSTVGPKPTEFRKSARPRARGERFRAARGVGVGEFGGEKERDAAARFAHARVAENDDFEQNFLAMHLERKRGLQWKDTRTKRRGRMLQKRMESGWDMGV